jgi:L-ascorbate metabolism protein UlaG (beta-lactamase superfamily)
MPMQTRIAAITLLVLFLLTGCGSARPAITPAPTVIPETPLPTSTLQLTAAPTPLPTATQPAIATAVLAPTAEAFFDGVRVTYVGNSGFLITVGDKKVLIDALFEGFKGNYALPQAVQDLLVNARPPFDDVDLILATHDHADHFSTSTVRQHMQNDPAASFVSTAQAASQLTAFGNRVVSLAATQGKPDQVTVNGIQVEALYLSHGAVPSGETEIINFGYIVTVNGIKLFHTGDIDASLLTVAGLQAYGLPEKQLDLAFIPHFILSSRQSRSLVEEGIKSQYIFPSHYKYTPQPNPSLIKSYYPGAVLFDSEMQSWVMP